MKDFRGNKKQVKYLGIVTGEQFEMEYNKLSSSPDKVPLASNLIPVQQSMVNVKFDGEGINPASLLFTALIYYETKKEEEKEGGAVVLSDKALEELKKINEEPKKELEKLSLEL